MASESIQVVNMDDLAAKRELMSRIGTLRGLYEVSIKPRRRTRTLNQNSYYWSAVVGPWLTYLREAYGEPSIDKDQAHEALKEAVLGRQVLISATTGREIEIPARTRTMKTDEFAQYIEAAAKFLAEFAHIVVLSPEMFYEKQ